MIAAKVDVIGICYAMMYAAGYTFKREPSGHCATFSILTFTLLPALQRTVVLGRVEKAL
jgi:hypothetical protein